MATDTRDPLEPTTDSDDPSDDPSKDWYDRSSLTGDFPVMIADQTEEDYLRRCPENRFCEFIDGVVYLHANESDLRDTSDPDDPTKDWYDRSSLVGDFMVMIPDQTEEEYFRRCPENKFCELIDGVVYMPSPVTLWHQFEVQFLLFLLKGFTTRRHAGIVLTGSAALRIGDGRCLEPDLFVIPPDGQAQFHHVYCDPPALLVVEILSKSTRSNDLKRKAELYRETGVIEVWFVDDRDQVLIVHRRTDQGYEVERIESGPYRSQAIAGFWLEVSWLWEQPEPDVFECLNAILAGPPA